MNARFHVSRSTGNDEEEGAVFHVSRSTGNTAKACTSCSKPTTETRKGLCKGCHLRAHRGHTLGTTCAICGTGDMRVLRRHTLALGKVTLCANHSAIAGRRHLTLGELRAEVYPPGDRRREDRRGGDRRAVRERRQTVDVSKLLEEERRRIERRRK